MTKLTRRDLGLAGVLGLLTGVMPKLTAHAGEQEPLETAEQAMQRSVKAHDMLMTADDLIMHGEEQILMLAYPGFTALDLIGPQYMFASMMGASVHIVTTEDDLSPVMSDTGVAIQPTMLMADVPEQVDVLFVPGSGRAILDTMKNEKTVGFVRDTAKRARYVTAVCTGSLILGMAGLLEGKRATSHWVSHDILAEFGAIPVKDRVVTDGNLITGGGVTAGIDFGLSILAEMRGDNYARTVQLQAKYAPAPPFDAGTPESAGPFLTESLAGMFDPLTVEATRLARASRAG